MVTPMDGRPILLEGVHYWGMPKVNSAANLVRTHHEQRTLLCTPVSLASPSAMRALSLSLSLSLSLLKTGFEQFVRTEILNQKMFLKCGQEARVRVVVRAYSFVRKCK